MKRQISQKRQIDAGRAGKIIVNRVRVRVGPVGQFKQRQGQIGRNRQREFGFSHRGNFDGTVADAACDEFPIDVQFRVQPANR